MSRSYGRGGVHLSNEENQKTHDENRKPHNENRKSHNENRKLHNKNRKPHNENRKPHNENQKPHNENGDPQNRTRKKAGRRPENRTTKTENRRTKTKKRTTRTKNCTTINRKPQSCIVPTFLLASSAQHAREPHRSRREPPKRRRPLAHLCPLLSSTSHTHHPLPLKHKHHRRGCASFLFLALPGVLHRARELTFHPENSCYDIAPHSPPSPD